MRLCAGIFLCAVAVLPAAPYILPDLPVRSAWAGADSRTIDRKIQDLRKEYEESKKELEERRKRLKEKEEERKKVLDNLKRSEKDINELRSTLIRIKDQEKRLDREIDTSRMLYMQSENDLEARSDEYAARLRSMYKRQRMSPLRLFFTTGSVSAMMRGIKMFGTLAREDVAVMNEIDTHLDNLDASLKKLNDAVSAQRSLAKRKQREELSLQKTRTQRQALLEEIKRDEELEKRLILERQKEMEEAQALIEKLLRERTREVSGSRFLEDISDDIKNYDFASRKGRLPWPVKGRVTSGFGVVTDPKTKTKTRNRGIEIATKQGEPVCAVGSGVVIVTQSIRGYGNFVMVFHPPEHVTIYAHLSDILVNVQTEVREGDIIGLAGSTGLIDDSSPSLLLEIINGKNPEDPLSWLTRGGGDAGS